MPDLKAVEFKAERFLKMEILELIDSLEDIIENGRNIPFIGKCLLDKDELLDIIQEIRLKFPDELKQAKWVKDERQRILAEAQKEANDIVKKTEDKMISMINENEITKKAKETADEIITNANKRSKEIKQGTRQYTEEVLADMEKIMEQTLLTLRGNRIAMQEKEKKKFQHAEQIALSEAVDNG